MKEEEIRRRVEMLAYTIPGIENRDAKLRAEGKLDGYLAVLGEGE